MKATLIILTASLVFVLGVWWGYPLLRKDIDSYDATFHACMEIRKSWIPVPYRQNFQSPEYDQIMTDCEREANR